VAGVTGIGAVSQAATFTWDANSGTDNNWSNANNWTANSGTPGALDEAQWSGGSTPDPSIVDLTQNEAAQFLDVISKDVTFNLNNFTLTVGGATTTIRTDTSVATFNGAGTATFNSLVLVGNDGGTSGSPTGHANIKAQGGATVNTNAGFTLGDYRTGGIATVDGVGTVWNSKGPVQLTRGGSGGRIQTQPRARLFITNGAVFNHDTGASGTALDESFTAGGSAGEALIEVDGAGSQLNFTGGYGPSVKLSSTSKVTVNVINGGVLAAPGAGMGLSFNNGTVPSIYNVGAGSTMTAGTWAVAGRSNSDINRGPNVVNLTGLLEATDDQATFGVSIGDRGVVTLQGGTISTPAGVRVTLRNAGVAGAFATLEGNGTIQGGDVYVEGDSILRPGLATTGTITVQDGDLNVLSNTAQLQWELSTDDGSHDSLEMLASGSTANVAGVLSFTNLGAGVSDFGIMDFLIADLINYNTVAGAVSSGDVPLNTDNLDSVMTAAGYTRVFDTPDESGEYRYLIASNVFGDLDALRVETVLIPEPASLGLLGVGGLALLRRRRRSA
jgi:hypothetical protein